MLLQKARCQLGDVVLKPILTNVFVFSHLSVTCFLSCFKPALCSLGDRVGFLLAPRVMILLYMYSSLMLQ